MPLKPEFMQKILSGILSPLQAELAAWNFLNKVEILE